MNSQCRFDDDCIALSATDLKKEAEEWHKAIFRLAKQYKAHSDFPFFKILDCLSLQSEFANTQIDTCTLIQFLAINNKQLRRQCNELERRIVKLETLAIR